MSLWYKFLEIFLPFSCFDYQFMKNAFLAILIITPIFALLGIIVVNNRLVFFSDCLGHSGLTGIAIGIILGINPTFTMILLGIFLAIAVTFLKHITDSAQETILGVVLASITALGIVLLSQGGNFSKFTPYLIGDILAISPKQIFFLTIIWFVTIIYSFLFTNSLTLLSVNNLLAKSKNIYIFLLEVSFTIILAITVIISLQLVGILVISALLVLPAATARILAASFKTYTILAIIISLVSGILGLIMSYYFGTATGATIVLINSGFYLFALIIKKGLRQ